MELMEFSYQESDVPIVWHGTGYSKFVGTLKEKWDKLHEEDTFIFRYNIKSFRERIVDNKYLLMLNPDRGSKRREAEIFESIFEPFDTNKFNFTKIPKIEKLLNIVNNKDDEGHAIIINVSPISRYHSLICPFVNKHLPQIATGESIKLILEIFFLCQDRDLRIGFNSLCALASVNHLHYHILFEKTTLPIETMKCTHVTKSVFHSRNYPVSAFCFQLSKRSEITQISKDITTLLDYLLKKNIAHNLMISRGQSLCENGDNSEIIRVIVWPRKSNYGVKDFSAFNVAVCELSGWFPMFSEDAFENFHINDLEVELKSWNLNEFSKLVDDMTQLFNNSK